jgi:prepilin-type N-terminal cleavage/methylation domain-containing protein
VTSRWLRTYARHDRSSSRRRSANAVPGFTLVEVVVASAIVLIILGGLFSVISYTYYAGASTETFNAAKNIADYSLEYLRARNVTTPPSGVTQVQPNDVIAGQSFYNPSTATTGLLPGLLDLTGTPLAINSMAVCPNGNIYRPSDGAVNTTGKATLSTLQGWLSLRNVNALTTDPWETNAVILPASGSPTRSYFDMITRDPYVIRFGTVDAAVSPASAIHSFSSSTGYAPYIWSSLTTNLHFAPNPATGTTQTACRAYTGYRILTQITAHSNDVTYRHVEYYDVQITVYWMIAGKELSYANRTTIATY